MGNQRYTIDRKYFVLRIFRAQNFVVFNFRGWLHPQKLNLDHTLYGDCAHTRKNIPYT